MTVPAVTVVIPTRDRWPLLSVHALPSALGQEDVEFEVVVVDDGSTDGTTTQLEAVEEPRLRLVRHDTSRGVAAARNAGIAAARGDWLAFLDDDDLWSPRKLRTQLDAALESGADFVYAAAVLVDCSRQVIAADLLPAEDELVGRLLEGNVIPGGCSSVLARTALVRALGGFDEALTYTEDWDLWLRLALAGRAIACPEILVAHVEHDGNALFRYRPDVVSEFERVLTKHATMGALPVVEGRRRVIQWLAHEYVTAGRNRQAARAYLQLAREQRSLAQLARAALVLSGLRPAAAGIRRRLGGNVEVRSVTPPAPDWLRANR